MNDIDATRRPPAATSATSDPAASRWLRRPIVAGLVLVVAYAALTLLMDPTGSLGTDTGGKVATLEMMEAQGLDPDVGWWAAADDPDAELHGLYYTSRIGDRYVNVTTLPMIVVAHPLYDLGGYRAALLVPMLGAVAAAFAARALAQRVGADDSVQWHAYWLTGLASPLTIYALDLWEHTWGAALMAWGIVAVVDATDPSRVGARARLVPALAAGLAFGAGFSMRTEALAYGFAAVGAGCVLLAVRRRAVTEALAVGAAAVVGLGLAVVTNSLLEISVLGQLSRTARASNAASRGGLALGERLEEGVITATNLQAASDPASLTIGVGAAAGMAYVAWRAARRGDQRPAQVVAVAVALLYLLRLTEGLGFVPGMIATTPFVAVGVVLAWSRPAARLPAGVALGALPLVWLFQFRGGALPQWGGRYVLASGLVLAALGIAASPRMARWARRFFTALAVAVTVLGLAWMAERTRGVGDMADDVAARPEPVLISDVEFWLREAGAVYPGSRWMTVRDDADLDRAVAIVEGGDDSFGSFGLLQLDLETPPPSQLGPFVLVGTDRYVWLNAPFRISTYARDG